MHFATELVFVNNEYAYSTFYISIGLSTKMGKKDVRSQKTLHLLLFAFVLSSKTRNALEQNSFWVR